MMYPNCHACFRARRVEKFREISLPGPRVIMANRLNFMPFFKCLLLKIAVGLASPVGCGLASLFYFLSRKMLSGQHSLRGEIWFSTKLVLGG